MASPLLPITGTPKRSLDERRVDIYYDLGTRPAAGSWSFWRQPLAGGVAKRLLIALVAGVVCVLGFSILLPVSLLIILVTTTSY